MTNFGRWRIPHKTRWRWTPRGRVPQFGIRDAITVTRKKQSNLSPGLKKSELWKSAENIFKKQRRNLQSAKKQFYKKPSTKTHNNVSKAAKTLEDTLRRLNEMHQTNKYNKRESSSFNQVDRTRQYSIANITERYQSRSQKPYQYDSSLRRLGQTLRQTHRTPQHSFLRQLEQPLYQTHRMPA